MCFLSRFAFVVSRCRRLYCVSVRLFVYFLIIWLFVLIKHFNINFHQSNLNVYEMSRDEQPFQLNQCLSDQTTTTAKDNLYSKACVHHYTKSIIPSIRIDLLYFNCITFSYTYYESNMHLFWFVQTKDWNIQIVHESRKKSTVALLNCNFFSISFIFISIEI